MLRFGLSGTNWTRKTTTISKLVARLPPAAVETIALSSLVRRSPHPMRDHQTVAASEWMIEQVRAIVAAEAQVDNQIFDRTPLDIIAFTRYAIDRANGTDSTFILDRIADLSAKFDVIFFCPPDGDWPSPVQPTDEARRFALLIDGLMRSLVPMMRTRVINLPWSAVDRLAVILNWIEERLAGREDT